MNRRRFLAVSAGLLAVPRMSEAQAPKKVPRVGYVDLLPIPSLLESFRQGLRDHGWKEGDDIAIEARVADGRLERVPGLVAELVRLKVDVLLLTAMAVRAGRPAAGTLPIVFVIADDPVKAGLVMSLARPGGRLTGITSLNVDLDAKRLEILKSALPGTARAAVFVTSRDPMSRDRVAAAEGAARALGLQLQTIEISGPARLPAAFDAATRGRADAVMVLGSPIFFSEQKRFAELATVASVPVISAWREFVDAGGLMAYGTNIPAMFRRSASYVDRILKGARPGDLPVEQADTFELAVNAKTARALGLTIPPTILARADHIIE